MFTFDSVPLPSSDPTVPSDELERLLVELVASENQRLAAASPEDGKRLALYREASAGTSRRAQPSAKEGPSLAAGEGVVAANRRANLKS